MSFAPDADCAGESGSLCGLYDFAPIGYITLTGDALISKSTSRRRTAGEKRSKLLHRRFAASLLLKTATVVSTFPARAAAR